MTDQTRREMIKSRAYGLTDAEIAAAQDISERKVSETLDAVQPEELAEIMTYWEECSREGN